jgi:hypothetical protein
MSTKKKSEKVYCEDCKWYFYKLEYVDNAPTHKCCARKIEKVTPPTPIRKSRTIAEIVYENCLIKNAHNDCTDFERGLDIPENQNYDCYD